MVISASPAQIQLCQQFGLQPAPVSSSDRLGISANVRDGGQPLNGMRYLAENGTCGWYLWAGEELPTDADFFLSLHVDHLSDWSAEMIKYLALPPGWRFLRAPGYEDVWFDESLLDPTEYPST